MVKMWHIFAGSDVPQDNLTTPPRHGKRPAIIRKSRIFRSRQSRSPPVSEFRPRGLIFIGRPDCFVGSERNGEGTERCLRICPNAYRVSLIASPNKARSRKTMLKQRCVKSVLLCLRQTCRSPLPASLSKRFRIRLLVKRSQNRSHPASKSSR